MTDGITVHSPPYEHALARLVMTSKKGSVEVMRFQGRQVFPNVAKYTPPAPQGVTGKSAELQGKRKVAADIRALYGTVSDAYDVLAAESPAKASAFWFLNEHNETRQASDILRSTTGSILYPFDNGVHHQRNFRRHLRKSKAAFTFYVSDPDALEAYIKKEQSHVWWLASGWGEALTALHAKIPYGIDKGNAPGALHVEITSQRIEITMASNVSFGDDVRGIENRIRWAMNIQTPKLDRAWEYYLKSAAKEAGFTKA